MNSSHHKSPASNTTEYVRPSGAAKYAAVAPRTIRDWMSKRLIPYSRVSSRCVLIRLADLDAFIARSRVENFQ